MRTLTATGVLLILVGLLGPPAVAESRSASELEIRVALLYHLAKGTRWPGNVSDGTPLVFCVVGNRSLAKLLATTLVDKRVQQRPVSVLEADSEEVTADACHVLFLGLDGRERTQEVLARVAQGHVLTVAATALFLEDGGIVNIIRTSGKLRFEVNIDAARDAGLTLKPSVLKVASRVYRPERDSPRPDDEADIGPRLCRVT